MAILTTILVLLSAACYSPDLPSCTVTCESDADCGDGQRCSRHVCSRENVRCDGDPSGTDAAVVVEDSPLEPDAPSAPQTMLRIKIMEMGLVHIPGEADCDEMDCSYSVDRDVPLTLEAEPLDNRFFEKWEDACSGLLPSCTVTPSGFETRVTARFKKR